MIGLLRSHCQVASKVKGKLETFLVLNLLSLLGAQQRCFADVTNQGQIMSAMQVKLQLTGKNMSCSNYDLIHVVIFFFLLVA